MGHSIFNQMAEVRVTLYPIQIHKYYNIYILEYNLTQYPTKIIIIIIIQAYIFWDKYTIMPGIYVTSLSGFIKRHI